MTFLDEWLNGRVEAWQIHDHITDWEQDPDHGLDLAAHLGMTWEQYRAWADRGELPQRRAGGA